MKNFLFVRPSKNFLFPELQKEIISTTQGVGVDAACANFKSRNFFNTDIYLGLDIDLQMLREGVKNNTKKNSAGILADITKMDHFPKSFASLVVSTNTLYSLPQDKRLLAIENLIQLVAPSGKFVFDQFLDDSLQPSIDMVKKEFSYVKVLYFKNPISRFYESLFEKNGYLGSHPIAGLLPFRALSWLISRFEYITCHSPKFNRHALVVATDKNSKTPLKLFDFNTLPRIEDNIFNGLPIKSQ